MFVVISERKLYVPTVGNKRMQGKNKAQEAPHPPVSTVEFLPSHTTLRRVHFLLRHHFQLIHRVPSHRMWL